MYKSQEINYSDIAETVIFTKLSEYRIVKNREFFDCDITQIKNIIEETEKEFNEKNIIDIVNKYNISNIKLNKIRACLNKLSNYYQSKLGKIITYGNENKKNKTEKQNKRNIDIKLFNEYADCVLESEQVVNNDIMYYKCRNDMVFNKDEYNRLLELLMDEDNFNIHTNIRHLTNIQNNDDQFNSKQLKKVTLYKQLCEHIENKNDPETELIQSIINVFNIRQTKINLEKMKRTIQKSLFGELFSIIRRRKTARSKIQYLSIINEEELRFHYKVMILSKPSLIDNKYDHIINETI